MAEVASVFQTKRIGVEATAGTLVAANKQLQSIGFQATISPEIEDFTPDGSKSTGLTQFIREMTEVSVSGKPTYDELTYLFAMLFGPGSLTVPTAGVYRRRFYMRNRAPDPIKTLTMDFGYDQYWYRAGYVFLKEFNFKVDNGGVEVDGSGMGQQLDMTVQSSSSSARYTATITGSPTGGTFTLTKDGQTTSGIAQNASASAVQTALEGLSTIGAGNVAVSGNNGGPYTISFINDLADQAVTITGSGAGLTGGTSPNLTVASVQAGAAPTLWPLKPILLTHCDLYMADTYAGLSGASALDRGFAFEFKISDKADVVKPIRSTVSGYAAHVETKPTVEASLTVAADSVGRSLITAMRSNATKYLKMKAVGQTISGAEKYYLEINLAVQVKELSGPEDTDGVYALNWTFSVVNDTSIESGFEIILQNTVDTL